MTVPPCLCFSSVSIQENADDCNMGFLTKTSAALVADCTFRLWRTKMQTQDWAFCTPNGAEHFNPAFECAGGAVGFAKPHPPFRRPILFCLARNCNVQPLFLCAAKKKPLAVKRKRQRGISISPFAIPLKRPRRGLRPPSLDFPRSLIRTEIIFGFTKRGTDAYLPDRRGSRNTLRLFRMPFAWKIVTRDTQSSPCRKNGLSTFIRQIFNGRKQNDLHSVSCAWKTRFYGRPKGVPCGTYHR